MLFIDNENSVSPSIISAEKFPFQEPQLSLNLSLPISSVSDTVQVEKTVLERQTGKLLLILFFEVWNFFKI